MNIKNEWKYHIVLGAILVTMDFIENFVISKKQELLTNHVLILFLLSMYCTSTIVYFTNFKIVCPKFLKRNNVFQFVIAVLGLFILFSGVRFFLDEVILYQITGLHNYQDESRTLYYYIFDNSYYAIKPVLYSTLVYLTIKFIEVKDFNKAELDLLKSQISPHFLFNTLNAFYVELIDDKPSTAKDIHKLSELLRYVIYDSKNDVVSLNKEIIFLKDYVHFYNKRFENELSIDFSIDGEIQNQQIPSLILIHFVENLFKHGVVNDKNDPAMICIHINESDIVMKTKNKSLTSEKYMESGIGTDNVKRRLTTLFDSNYKLEYKTDESYFYSYLKMPL